MPLHPAGGDHLPRTPTFPPHPGAAELRVPRGMMPRGRGSRGQRPLAGYFPQHFLYLAPLPQGQGSLRPTLGPSRRTVVMPFTSPST